MARWQRDPTMRLKMTYLLVAVEALAIGGNVYPIFGAYLYQLCILMGGTVADPLISAGASNVLTLVVAVASLILAIVVGVAYARGRAWARKALIAANVVLVALGVIWFLKNRLAGSRQDTMAAMAGLLLPIVTLFPLLWPLLVFRSAGAVADDDTQGRE